MTAVDASGFRSFILDLVDPSGSGCGQKVLDLADPGRNGGLSLKGWELVRKFGLVLQEADRRSLDQADVVLREAPTTRCGGDVSVDPEQQGVGDEVGHLLGCARDHPRFLSFMRACVGPTFSVSLASLAGKAH